MKHTVQNDQRGFLYRDGNFEKLLPPGKYSVWAMRKEKLDIKTVGGQINVTAAQRAQFLEDDLFASETIGLDVGDNELALWYVDGRIKGTLGAGSYRFWNVFEKNTFRVLDMTKPETDDISRAEFRAIPESYFMKAEVKSGEVGLLFVDGAFQKELPQGTYFYWNHQNNVKVNIVDMRVRMMEVSGQEILTADKVSLRLNFVAEYRVTDAVSQQTKLSEADKQVYSAVQLALREYVGRFRLDALLEQKGSFAKDVLLILRDMQARLFVTFVDAGLKDIILPGEIRDIMNTVLVAEKQAQANVIARREEVASTRSLLNTAKLLEENATLARLKEMETLERIFDKVGTISLTSEGGVLGQLRTLVGGGK